MIGLFLAAAVAAAPAPAPAPAAASAPAPAPAAPELSPPCREAMDGDWAQAVAAFDAGRFDVAEALNAQVRQTCASDALVLPMLATFGADIARMSGDPAQAIALLDAARPADSSRLWPRSQLITLWAYKALGDEAQFKAERDHMLSVNEARMLAGDYWMKQERFETPAAFVDVFRRRVRPGDPNDTLFIAAPPTATTTAATPPSFCW